VSNKKKKIGENDQSMWPRTGLAAFASEQNGQLMIALISNTQSISQQKIEAYSFL